VSRSIDYEIGKSSSNKKLLAAIHVTADVAGYGSGENYGSTTNAITNQDVREKTKRIRLSNGMKRM